MVSRKKLQQMLHIRCFTLRKLFIDAGYLLIPFIDAGFQKEPISVACVKSSPNKYSLLL